MEEKFNKYMKFFDGVNSGLQAFKIMLSLESKYKNDKEEIYEAYARTEDRIDEDNQKKYPNYLID